MVPYRGRQALRIARVALALASSAWYFAHGGWHLTWTAAVMIAYAVYSLGALLEVQYDTPVRSAIGTSTDAGFLALWCWLDPYTWVATLAIANLLTGASLLLDVFLTIAAAGVALFITVVVPAQNNSMLIWTALATSAALVGVAYYKRFLTTRMSNTLRHNVMIRSQAEGAREAERQRIAADFHDGPLQSFVGFQMRLEIIRRLLKKDPPAAAEELSQLQDLCRGQVADLRSFVRSMRPTDEGMSLAASLSRMTDTFQKDSGIQAAFSAEEMHDPGEPEISLEILQIVREALHNIQKHAGADRVNVAAARRGPKLEVVVEDNGSGLPFAGAFSLDEMELLRMGPSSIKRRVRMLNGDLTIHSNPGHGSKVEIRIPV